MKNKSLTLDNKKIDLIISNLEEINWSISKIKKIDLITL